MGIGAAVAGAGLVGAGVSAFGASKAADAQEDAARRAAETQRYMFDTTREDMKPFRETGYQALDELKSMVGLGGQSDFDISQTPGYQFNLNQGLQAIDRSAAAGGTRLSGRAIKAAQRFGSGLASQEFGNRYNRLSGLAGLGGNVAQTQAQVGANTAANIGSAQMQAGNAQAAGYAGMGNAVNQGLSNVLYAYNRFGGQGGGAPDYRNYNPQFYRG